jgi:hypothetical protein
MSSPASRKPYLDAGQVDELFDKLPPLTSSDYIDELKTASAAELPAQVLVRAYRQLPKGSPAAEATLNRLLAMDDKYGYLAPLRKAAANRISDDDFFSEEDLVEETVREMAKALAGPRGKGADLYWIKFLYQRLEDGYRSLNGRRGERADPPKVRRWENEEGKQVNPADEAARGEATWHGNIDGDNQEWIEDFVKRQIEKIAEPRIREVARELFKADPPSMVELAERMGVDRRKVSEWRDVARARILAGLRQQGERDIDLSGWT